MTRVPVDDLPRGRLLLLLALLRIVPHFAPMAALQQQLKHEATTILMTLD